MVRSSEADDHSHMVQVEALVHCILAVEKDVVVEVDHRIVVVAADAYPADNLFVDHNKVVHEDYHMEDIVVDVVALDNVIQVHVEVVANWVDFDTYVEVVKD